MARIGSHSLSWRGDLPIAGNETALDRDGRRLHAGLDRKLREHGGDVVIDRFGGNSQPFGEISVAEAVDEAAEYLHLARRQRHRIALGCRSGAARNPPDALRAQPAAMKRGDFTGIVGIPAQDMAMWESMGRITDRSEDHFGSSDLAVAQFRRMMVAAAKKLSESLFVFVFTNSPH